MNEIITSGQIEPIKKDWLNEFSEWAEHLFDDLFEKEQNEDADKH